VAPVTAAAAPLPGARTVVREKSSTCSAISLFRPITPIQTAQVGEEFLFLPLLTVGCKEETDRGLSGHICRNE
jgi:hypothetical protein